MSFFSIPWFTEKRIGRNSIGNILPALCEIANVPRLTNNSIRPTSIRAMSRGGFDRNSVAFISGHKNPDTLMNYDGLTVVDRTKIALAIQKGPATLDGDRVNLDELARGNKRKSNDMVPDNGNPVPGTSKDDNPVPSTAKKVTFDEDDIRRACREEILFEDSGLGNSIAGEDNGDDFDAAAAMREISPNLPRVQLKQPDAEAATGGVAQANPGGDEGVTGALRHETQVHMSQEPHQFHSVVVQESRSTDAPALPSSQAHNVAQLITDHISSSKELINNYIEAMKKKK